MVNHDKINLESSQQNSFCLIMYLFQTTETRCPSGWHHLVLEVSGVKKFSTLAALTTDPLQPEQSQLAGGVSLHMDMWTHGLLGTSLAVKWVPVETGLFKWLYQLGRKVRK